MQHCNKANIALMLLLSGLLVFLPVRPALANDALTVAVIDVTGNNLVPTETILKVITKTQVGESIDPRKIDADIQAIQNLGYFIRVDWRMERVIGGIRVMFVVVENPPLKAIEVTGLTRVNPDDFKDKWGMKPGDVISFVAISKGIEKVRQYCQDQGFLVDADISRSSVTPDGIVKIHFVEYKLGGIKITGNEKTKDYVIRREISAVEGDVIDLRKLREDIQRLFRMGLFDDFNIAIEPGPGSEELTLVFEVQERKSRMIGFNFGYSRDLGFSGGLEFSDGNLFGMAQSFRTSLMLQQDSTTFEMAYNVPWLGPYRTSLGLEAYSRFDRDAFDLSDPDTLFNRRTNGGTITLGFPLAQDINGSVKLKVEQIHQIFPETASGLAETGPEVVTTNNRSLTFQLSRNKLLLENGMFVTGGNLSQFSLERAGGWLLGGDTDFYKLRGETRQFFSLAPQHVVGFRLTAGAIQGSTISSSELFMLGGSESLRGYDFRAFTGDRFALFNAEYRYRINQTFEGVLFLDLGDAWASQSTLNDPFNLNVGYGLGLRVNVPVLGQLRFDYGFKPGESGKFYFSFGEMF